MDNLTPDGYIPRIVDTELDRLLRIFGAVEIAGTMWCGKTWTALAHGRSVTRVGQAAGRAVAQADPASALIGETPHVIDEWQDVPAIWDEIRSDIDISGAVPGRFILTGSARPHGTDTAHSGAGRIGKLRMRTMSLQETGDSTGKISLAGLFNGDFEPFQTQQRLAPLADLICRGGWPAVIHNHIPAADVLDGYLDALFETNIPRQGLSGQEARRVAMALAKNTGTAAKLSTIAADAQFDPLGKVTEERTSKLIQALEALYMIEQVHGWDAPIRSKSRLRTKPKSYFSDPSLAAALLQISPERLLTDGQLFGMLFEALCMHDLAVYTAAMPQAQAEPLRYYRDSDGLEVDCIIELRDGRWAGIEIKLGENKVVEGAATLRRLQNKIAANPLARNPEPSFLAVIVGAAEMARFDRENGVYILPITALGP